MFALALVYTSADDASAVDENTLVQDTSGEMDYDHVMNWTIWSSDKKSEPYLKPGTRLVSANVDGRPGDELLFGSQNGSLIIIDASKGVELVNLSIPEYGISAPCVGELDGDSSVEIVFSSYKYLYCFDFQDRTIQWRKDYPGSPCRLLDLDGDGKDEILSRAGYRFRLLDHEGEEVYNVSLDIFNETLGGISDPIVEDIDGDGDLEVFLVDRGRGWNWPAWGRHIWIIDLASGALEHSGQYDELIFVSEPILVPWNASYKVAIGLNGDISENASDLMLFDPASKEYELFNLTFDRTGYDNEYNFLSLIPCDDGPLVLASRHHEHLIAWSVSDKKVLWNQSVPRSQGHVNSHAVTCDIDGNKDYEILVPTGPLYVIDAITGDIERTIQFSLQFDTLHPYSEHRMTVGDFDGDGYTEIVGGNKNWLKTDRYDIIYFDNAPTRIYIDGYSEDNGDVLYAGMEHNLRVVVTNVSQGYVLRIEIAFSNDPTGTFSNVSFNPSTGTFLGPGRESLLSIVGACTYDGNDLTIDLALTPSWDFSFEGLNDLTVNFTTRTGRTQARTFPEVFRVERDLVLVGEPASSWQQGQLEDGDWVLPGSAIQTRGLDVVYEGTTDLRPPPDAFTLEVFDGVGITNVTFEEGGTLTVMTLSPDSEGPFDVSIRMIENHLGTYGEGSYRISLNVDGSPPILLGIYPENGTWFCIEVFVIDVLIDDEGCGVDTGSVRYRMGDVGPGPGDEWKVVHEYELSKASNGWELLRSVKLEEGVFLIEWEVRDMLGQRLAFNLTIGVDLHGIYFDMLQPPEGWVPDTTMNVTARVLDRGGSGVNTSSLEYSYSHSDLLSFSQWAPVEVLSEGDRVTAFFNYTGVEGKTNLVRFRGKDLAGNELISSQVFEIWIDSRPPDVTIVHPVTRQHLDPSFRSVRVNVTDETSGVVHDIRSTVWDGERNISFDPTIELVESSLYHGVFDISWDADIGYHVKLVVRTSDNAGHSFDLLMDFFTARPPAISKLLPEEGSSYNEGSLVNFSVAYEDPDGDEVTVEWWLGGVLLSRETTFINSSLPIGDHNITVVLRDMYHEVIGHRNITIRETEEPVDPPPSTPDDPSRVTVDTFDWWFWLIVLVIVMMVALSALYVYRKRID